MLRRLTVGFLGPGVGIRGTCEGQLVQENYVREAGVHVT